MLKNFSIYLILFLFSFNANAKDYPGSFADLAERLMPSVVNISTTQIITTRTNPFPFEFPPGSPFEDMFRDFGEPKERRTSALGSGFIVDITGTVVTNNHFEHSTRMSCDHFCLETTSNRISTPKRSFLYMIILDSR